MTDDSHKANGGLGGVGGKAKNRAFKEPTPKKAVVTLVEREGHARSFYVASVTAKRVRPIIVTNASPRAF